MISTPTVARRGEKAPRGEDRIEPEVPEGDRADDELAGLCASQHPLLDGVRCQRMQGHPGRHGAHVDTSSAEITLEWTGKPEAEEDPAA